jgi:hypothetical protein
VVGTNAEASERRATKAAKAHILKGFVMILTSKSKELNVFKIAKKTIEARFTVRLTGFPGENGICPNFFNFYHFDMKI